MLNHSLSRLETAGARLLICIAHRTIEAEVEGGSKDSDQAYQEHRTCAACTTLTLQALSAQASSELLETQIRTIARPSTEASRWRQLKEQILKNAQGNPLFIVEMAHALIEDALSLDLESDVDRVPPNADQMQVPDTISRAILSRLDRLDEQNRTVLRVASVIGHEFEQWLLQAIYPYSTLEPEMERCLFELCTRELLDRSQLLYFFRHVMTRQVAYESLLYAERRKLHGQIASFLEKGAPKTQSAPEQENRMRHPDPLHPEAEVLAHHYTLAEEWSKALYYQMLAGSRARAVYANEDALHRYRRALQIAERVPGSDIQQQAAHEALSDILTTIGNYDDALVHMDQAIHLVLALEKTPEQATRHLADLFCRTAAIYEKKSDYSTAFDWLQGGLLALEGMQTIEAAHIYSMGAGIYHRQGDNAQALQWCENSARLAASLAASESADRAARDAARDALAHTLYLQGAIYLRYADYAQAAEVCRKSIDLYEQLDNLPGAGAAHNNLASALFDLGDWAQAAEHYRKALDIATQIGDVHESGLIANNLGEVYRYRGELEQARAHYEQSLYTWQTLGSVYGQAFLYMNLAAVALQEKEWQPAIEQLERCQRLCAEINAQDFSAEAYRYLAEAHVGPYVGVDSGSQVLDQSDREQIARALGYAQQSLRFAERQEMKLEEGATRRVLGRVHAVRGEHQAAERELSRSLEILEALDSQYQIGQTLVDQAVLYRKLNQPVEFRRRRDRAARIFEHLGARLDLERTRQLD
jgi:tetratricopeptide (TPR) repeat protein